MLAIPKDTEYLQQMKNKAEAWFRLPANVDMNEVEQEIMTKNAIRHVMDLAPVAIEYAEWMRSKEDWQVRIMNDHLKGYVLEDPDWISRLYWWAGKTLRGSNKYNETPWLRRYVGSSIKNWGDMRLASQTRMVLPKHE